MILTKEDLQDWNSHPVTKRIFEGIEEARKELKEESCLCETSDETAMKTALNEGIAQGINILKEAYELLEEDSE